MKYYLRKILYRVARKVIRLFVVLSIVFSLVFINMYKPVTVYASSNSLIDNLTNYIMATSGAIDVTAERIGDDLQAIVSQPSSVINRLKEKVSDLLGTGIYEDGNGNYVFSGQATNEIYEILNGSDSNDVRVVSDFGGVTANSALAFVNTPYVNAIFNQKLNEMRSLYTNYMIICTQGVWSTYTYTYLNCIDLGDSNNGCAYITVTDSVNYNFPSIYIRFYNDLSNSYFGNCSYFSMSYNGSSYSTVSEGTSSTDRFTIQSDTRYMNGTSSSSHDSVFIENLPVFDSGVVLNQFPYYVSGGSLIWSNRSIIVANNQANGNQFINNSSNIYVSNTYNTFPSISQTAIQNNNWENIYNSYVQNISNNSNQYITNNGIDKNALRQLMANYTNILVDNINNGVENIEQAIYTSNEWLQRIYDRLGQIYDLLLVGDGDGSSGGSSSSIDLSNIESYLSSMNTNISNLVIALNRLESNLPNYSAQLASQYTLLSNIYQALLNIGSGGGSGGGDNIYIPPTENPWEPYFHVIDDLPVETYNDIINQFDVIKQLMNEVAPFVYLGMISGILNRLNVAPVEPVFTIPISMDNEYISIDEDIEIDLTIFEDILPIIQGVFMIGFILSLIWLSAWLVPHILQMFDF